MIRAINGHTVAVETEDDLRNAVNSDNGIDYVYLANNIALESGITIFAGKTTLVIDGEYPIDSGNRNEFTDMNNALWESTIGIRSTSNITLTIKNMIINGRNYFGVPYVADNSLFVDTSGVTVVYENVSYTGSQITYNRYGLTRYIDCDITITQIGAQIAQEVGEVNNVEIGGKTTIIHTSTSATRSVFWFYDKDSTSSLTILPGAEVEIVSENNYFMYNHDIAIFPLVTVDYIIKEGASLSLTVNKGICYNNSHSLNSFTLEPNATFHYIQKTNNSSEATLTLGGALNVAQNAHFYMQAENGTQELIRYSNNPACQLKVENPTSFVLYSPGAAVLYSAGTTPFSFDCGQLNAWNTATTPIDSAGGFDDVTPNRWFKRDFLLPLEVSGSFTQGSTSATDNLAPEDEPHPSISNLHLHSARVLSLGDWPVIVNPVCDDGRPIAGWTEANANLIAEYTDGSSFHSIDTTAEDDGRFYIDTSGEIPATITAGVDITIYSNIPFLIKDVITTAIAAGELFIESAIAEIPYLPVPISTNPLLIPRNVTGTLVVVKDTRPLGTGTPWELLASLSEPLQTSGGDILPDAVVYAEGGDVPLLTLNSTPRVVFRGGPDIETTNVEWVEREGILLRITAPMRCGLEYTSRIKWELQMVVRR